MELKRKSVKFLFYVDGLLIVPYGIETNRRDKVICLIDGLLIVPYGIETMVYYSKDSTISLLIVPYGIETRMYRYY